jgi:hypothetical protein
MKYYNGTRTHLSLEKDAPFSRSVERAGQILCRPILGGLHHQYVGMPLLQNAKRTPSGFCTVWNLSKRNSTELFQ